MQAADVPARTWLLAGLAGWALAAWVLALAGMGARAPALPDDPALLQRLPQARAAAAPSLGPPGQYAAVSSRNLFSDDRRPKPFLVQREGEAAPEQAFDFVLTSVMITGTARLAILQSPDGAQSMRVRLGEAPDALPAWRLAALSARSATFEGPEGQRTLELRMFNGQGGQPPTSMSASIPGMSDAVNANTVTNARPAPMASSGAPPVQIGKTGPAPPAPAPPSAPLTEDAQIEAIRQRIEARRAQLRQQAQTPFVPPSPSQPPPAPTQ